MHLPEHRIYLGWLIMSNNSGKPIWNECLGTFEPDYRIKTWTWKKASLSGGYSTYACSKYRFQKNFKGIFSELFNSIRYSLRDLVYFHPGKFSTLNYQLGDNHLSQWNCRTCPPTGGSTCESLKCLDHYPGWVSKRLFGPCHKSSWPQVLISSNC